MKSVGSPRAEHQIRETTDARKGREFGLALWLLLAFGACPLRAQSQPDVNTPEARAAYVEQLTAENEAAKAEAELWADQHGMPVYDDDGYHTRELMGILDGRPLYYTTENVQSAISLATDRVREAPLWDLTGKGWAVGVWDAAGVRATHQEFVGPDGQSRVKIRDSLVTSSHSTHVAGTIAAAGADSNAKGMAPGARIESYDWNNDTAQMLSRAATGPGQPNNIYVSNHSYGYVVGWVYYASIAMTGHVGWHYTGEWKGRDSYDNWFGQYNTIARQWDEVAHMNSCYLAFAAAGNDRNDGPQPGETVYYYRSGWHEIVYSPSTCPPGDGGFKNGYDTISGPAVAKNIVTVGAVNDAVSAGTRSCVKTAMTKFSCWGPTDDGRIKPDIVANGVDVYSCDHDSNQDYTVYSGTSMASPAAAGSAILLVEHYAKLFPGRAMRSATLKALILHTADDLGRVGPDYQYGWGLMNTRTAAELIQEDRDSQAGDLIIEDSLDNQDSSDSYYLYTDGATPIRITLCWTDPPAAAITSSLDDPSPRLINDLDLRLIGPGGSPVYCPYVLDPAVPAAPARTGDNTVDNVEQVYVAAPGQAGAYEVRVSFKTLTGSAQRYSLVSNQPLVNQRAPVAEDVRTTVARNTPVTLTLKAADEGLPLPPGKLTYSIASLPLHGTLTCPDGTAITKSTTLAQNGSQVVYKPAAGFLGEDSFTFSADDGGVAPFGGVSNIATATISIQDIVTLQYQVGAGEDDAVGLAGWQATSGLSLRLGQYISAMRFQGVDVPKGARIVGATLRLRTQSVAKCKGSVYAEATGDAKDFTLMNTRVYDRAKTQASIAWNWSGDESSQLWYGSPDLSGVVQEIFDRSDWSAGNDLVILYVGKELTGDMPRFCSWEDDPTYAPKLEIVLAANPVGGGSPTSPTNPSAPGHSVPVAANLSLYANANTPAPIALAATDDGLPAPLDFVIDSLPAHGSLEYPGGTAITKTGTLAAHAGRVIYRPHANFAGNDAFRFHASDGGNAPSGGNSNVATVSIGVRNMVTREYQVILPQDDAYGADGPAVVLSDLLSVGRNDSAMRFQNVDILPGSEIVGARLKVGVGASTIKAKMNGVLRAQDVGDAADFTSPSVRIPNMTKTQASIPWSWQAGDCGPAGAFHASPDISAVVQEIVDRQDWRIDNALAILYSGDRTTSQDVPFFACESPYSARAARLEITCGLLEPAILPPTVDQAVPVAADAVIETPFNSSLTVTLPATDDDLPDPPGRLTYIIAALPGHGTLQDSQGKPITGSAVLPGFSNQVVYKPAKDFMGPDTFTFYVDDGAIPESSGESNIAMVRVMVRPPLTKKLSSTTYVKASEDDAYATRQDTSNKYTQPTLLVGLNSAGMRFTNIAIPQGSKIISARLTVRVSMWLPQGVAGVVQAESTGNAAGFSENDRIVGSLPLTDAFVDWIWSPGSYYGDWNNRGTVCLSPDIGQVVQEVVDRPDWTSGNAIALVLSSQNIPRSELQIISYNDSPTTAALTAPILSISYAPNDPQAFVDGGTTTTTPTPSVPASAITREYWVDGISNDASASGGTNSLFDQYLRVGAKHMSGMRFTNVNVPRGVRIYKAQLKITPLPGNLADRVDGLIQAEATGNASNFVAEERYLYNLPRTDAAVAWIWEAGFHDGYHIPGPDISAVVQEVVDRQDWSSGNAIDILFSCTNQPGADLQFLAYGFCVDPSSYCSPTRYTPGVLEITYAP